MASKAKPAKMTLDELRAAVLDQARQWIEWGGGLEDFLDGGPLPSSCIAGGTTGPGRPSIDYDRKQVSGHRSAICRAGTGEVTLTWARIRVELRRGRAGEQLVLGV